MAAKFTRPYCMVCGHYVRNQAQHNQTLEHRRKLNPHKRVSKKELRRRRPRRHAQSDYYQPVKKHRRSPPADGKRRTVQVRKYWRHERQPTFKGYG